MGHKTQIVKIALLRSDVIVGRAEMRAGADRGEVLVNGSALMVALTGSILRLLQNGMLRFYAYAFAVGVAAFVLYLSFSS